MKNKRVIDLFLRMERFLYEKSHRISVISEGFRTALLAKSVPNSKIELIPVWADPDEIQPLPKENSFRRAHGLVDKFVAMYAGNIGFTSCIEDVLDAAEIFRERIDIKFVIVGEGVKKEDLLEEMHCRQLTNVLILPYQPRAVFSEMLAAADVILVTLNADAAMSSLPSKVFSAMASARPIVTVAPLESDLAHIVARSGCGWTVPPTYPARIAALMLEISETGFYSYSDGSKRTRLSQKTLFAQ